MSKTSKRMSKTSKKSERMSKKTKPERKTLAKKYKLFFKAPRINHIVVQIDCVPGLKEVYPFDYFQINFTYA